MAEIEGQEKTEQATSKKLEESREKGQVARSFELNSFAIFLIGISILYLSQNLIGGKVKELSYVIFNSLDKFDINADMLQMLATKGALFFLSILAPFFIGLVGISLIAGYGQVGFKITPKAIQPKLSKFNIVNGFKNIFFSSRSTVELVKSVLKLVIISIFIYWLLSDFVKNASGIAQLSVREILLLMVDISFSFIWKITLLYAILAAADFAFQKYKHKKDLMMTKQEVKDELKQTEGDPLIKSLIRSKQLALIRSRISKELPTADVVITNPTHFAVALKYEMGNKSAPKVVAKGADLLAKHIKDLAKQFNIPIYEDPSLARALYKYCDVGDEIPQKLFKAVAQVLAYIYKMKNKTVKNKIV